ncbi:MAG: hypothetical protein HKN76_21045 [Saprospiraceae bacterium]|nr:hypothetical protein [Saprospiraceae bacterium]
MDFKLAVIYLLLAFLPMQDTNVHTFYISVCYITQEEEQVQVDYRMFKNDLDQALRAAKRIEPEMPSSDYCAVVALYVQNHFQISTDADTIAFNLLQCDLAGEGQLETVTCKLQGSMPSVYWSNMRIKSTVLLDEFEDQVNMMHAKINGIKKSVNLDRDRISFNIP